MAKLAVETRATAKTRVQVDSFSFVHSPVVIPVVECVDVTLHYKTIEETTDLVCAMCSISGGKLSGSRIHFWRNPRRCRHLHLQQSGEVCCVYHPL